MILRDNLKKNFSENVPLNITYISIIFEHLFYVENQFWPSSRWSRSRVTKMMRLLFRNTCSHHTVLWSSVADPNPLDPGSGPGWFFPGSSIPDPAPFYAIFLLYLQNPCYVPVIVSKLGYSEKLTPETGTFATAFLHRTQDPGWKNSKIRIRDKTSRIRNTAIKLIHSTSDPYPQGSETFCQEPYQKLWH
jgi:hypothetical protein